MTTTTNLIDVYSLMTTGGITEDEAAGALGFTPQQFKMRLAKWGHKLPLLFAILDKIKVDTITREEAAQTLNVSAREINKLQMSWKVVRPVKGYLVDQAATQIKWEIRRKYAIDFIAGGMELEEAADSAGVSTRQMRRWVTDLLVKHYEMPYKDLTKLSLIRRKRLADEVEEAENLEMAKQQVLKSIADGKQSIEDEALRRVLAKRTIGYRRRASDR